MKTQAVRKAMVLVLVLSCGDGLVASLKGVCTRQEYSCVACGMH